MCGADKDIIQVVFNTIPFNSNLFITFDQVQTTFFPENLFHIYFIFSADFVSSFRFVFVHFITSFFCVVFGVIKPCSCSTCWFLLDTAALICFGCVSVCMCVIYSVCKPNCVSVLRDVYDGHIKWLCHKMLSDLVMVLHGKHFSLSPYT